MRRLFFLVLVACDLPLPDVQSATSPDGAMTPADGGGATPGDAAVTPPTFCTSQSVKLCDDFDDNAPFPRGWAKEDTSAGTLSLASKALVAAAANGKALLVSKSYAIASIGSARVEADVRADRLPVGKSVTVMSFIGKEDGRSWTASVVLSRESEVAAHFKLQMNGASRDDETDVAIGQTNRVKLTVVRNITNATPSFTSVVRLSLGDATKGPELTAPTSTKLGVANIEVELGAKDAPGDGATITFDNVVIDN